MQRLASLSTTNDPVLSVSLPVEREKLTDVWSSVSVVPSLAESVRASWESADRVGSML